MSSAAHLLDQIQGLSPHTQFDEWRDKVTSILRLVPSQLYLHSDTTAMYSQPGLYGDVVIEVDRTIWMRKGMMISATTEDGVVSTFRILEVQSEHAILCELQIESPLYPEGTIVPAGSTIVVAGEPEFARESPNDPVFNEPVSNEDLSFTVSWELEGVSDFVHVQWGAVDQPIEAGNLRWTRAWNGQLRIEVDEPGDYWIRGWTQTELGPYSENATTISQALAVGLSGPQDVVMSNPAAHRLDVTWAPTANFWTFVQVFPVGGDRHWELHVPQGVDGVTFEDLPEGHYTARLWHQTRGTAKNSDMTEVATPVYVAAAQAPAGFGAEIVDDTLIVFWTEAFEPWIIVQWFPHTPGSDEGVKQSEIKTLWAAAQPWSDENDRYEWKVQLPRARDYWVLGWGQRLDGKVSPKIDDVLLTAENGYLDVAERKATWADVTGDGRPADNADVTAAAMTVGVAIDDGGIAFTGDDGFIKHRYDGSDSSYLDATGGFFLGLVGGDYGFLCGNTTEHIIFDPATNDFRIQIGTGNSAIELDGSKFRYGGDGGIQLEHSSSWGGAILRSEHPTDGDAYMTMFRSPGLCQLRFQQDDSMTQLVSQPAPTYPDTADATNINGLVAHEGAGVGEFNYGRYTPRGLEIWTRRGLGVDTRQAALTNQGELFLGGVQVLGTPKTTWGLPQGTLSRAQFDTSTVTHTELARVVAALVTDLHLDSPSSDHALLANTLN